MSMTTLSSTPLSPLAFGTMMMGGPADEAASRAMFDACIAAGLNHFDTAYVYQGGASERLLGQFAAPIRDQLYIATKVGYTGGAGADNIRKTFDECRTRLNMDAVDLLYMHRFDPDTPLEATFECLAQMQSQGLFRHIGVSNYAAWEVMKAQAVAATFGTRIDWLQPMYSLVKRQAEVELLPMAADQGISVAPYSPLGGGLLTGKYASGGTGRLTEDARYATRYGQDWMHAAASGLSALATEMGQNPATLAVAWAASHPAVTAPIISARSAEQLAPSLAALDQTLDAPTRAAITALSQDPPPATDRLEEA